MDQPLTSPWRRLAGFLIAHLAVDLLALIPLVLCLIFFAVDVTGSFEYPWLVLPSFLAVAVYFPLGMLVAKWRKWSVPTQKDNVLTTVLPAVGLVLCVLCGMLCPIPTPVGSGSFLILLFFFAPQMVFFFTFAFLLGSPANGLLILLAVFLAPLLPPLLFTLGSAWQSKRQAPQPLP